MLYDDDDAGDEFLEGVLAEARADQDLDTPGPGPLPVPKTVGVRRAGSSAAAERRRDDAERKRVERLKRREAGLLETPSIDGAIVAALAAHLARMGVKDTVALAGAIGGLRVPLLPVFGEAKVVLMEKGATAESAALMLAGRLLGTPQTPKTDAAP
ncbi:hypothetical protein ABZT49_32820 [Methylobacterium sp. EM32]|uniref:hypothetical protein n=1 Tax=Methylobacterium sp. EM32 TaxID=3163481 RepID=UPI0033B1C2B1